MLEKNDRYRVVVNEEGRYSVWRSDSECPDGWSWCDMTGSMAECLAYIDEVWADLRPVPGSDRDDLRP